MAQSSILHTEALILRAINYSETSRIVTLFTRENGKMSVIAKGARASKSRFGSTLEPMSHVELVIHCKPTRELQILSEATHVRTHDALRSSLDRMETGFRVIELASSLMQSEQKNGQVFALLVATMMALDSAPGRTENLWPFFQLRMASNLGFGPSFDGDLVKSMQEEEGFLDLRSGQIITHPEAGQVTVRASRVLLRAFAVLTRASLNDVMRMEMDPETSAGIRELVTAYLRHHVEDSYPTRSAKVFEQLTL